MGPRNESLDFRSLEAKEPEVTGKEALETFTSPASSSGVRMETDEVTAVCPVTGQPDWYTITIDYLPKTLCLESKSLKLYFLAFRNRGIFCEMLAEEIAGDLYKVLEPLDIAVTVKQKSRGGISITAASHLPSREPSANPTRQQVS